MKINTTNTKEGFNYMNDLNVIISNTYSQGIGDSLGRTARGLFIYDEQFKELLDGVMSYFRYVRTSPEQGYRWYATRYPRGEDWAVIGNSRDHITYAITSLHILHDKLPEGYRDFVEDFVKHRAKRPRIMKAYTLDQKLWFKALFSNGYSFLYGSVIVVWLRFIQVVKWLVRFFGGNGEKVLPTYALIYSLWGMQAIKSKWVKRQLKKVFKPHFDKGNYVARMLCGDTFTDEEIYSFIPTRRNRWAIRLDEEAGEDLTRYPNDKPEWNVVLGLLYVLHENQKKYGSDKALGV